MSETEISFFSLFLSENFSVYGAKFSHKISREYSAGGMPEKKHFSSQFLEKYNTLSAKGKKL